MAELSYLKLKNASEGQDIPGEPIDKNWDGHIEIVAFEHEAIRPTMLGFTPEVAAGLWQHAYRAGISPESILETFAAFTVACRSRTCASP